jgi:hypothetical protein
MARLASGVSSVEFFNVFRICVIGPSSLLAGRQGHTQGFLDSFRNLRFSLDNPARICFNTFRKSGKWKEFSTFTFFIFILEGVARKFNPHFGMESHG